MLSKPDSQLVYQLLEQVSDPEVPVLSVVDLGVVRRVAFIDQELQIDITPTYSGCPAMDMIRVNILSVLQENGFNNVSVNMVMSPAWTTDWISEKGKIKLREYGIAPPVSGTADKMTLFGEPPMVPCPRCGMENTKLLSQFGSTACKALYQCQSCKEPFDYFKCH